MSNTPELVAQYLRQAILRGELRSQQPVRQDKVAEALGVSKVPVREALAQLKVEGLVSYRTNRGAFVTGLMPAEAREIYLMRMALETMALEHAIPNLTKAHLARAQSALMVIDVEEDSAMWSELNWEFHAAIYQQAQMPHLLSMIEMLHVNVARYLVLYLDRMQFQTKSQVEHYELLAACQQGDVQTAVSILKQHLQDASTALETFLTDSQPK
ncbi:MAG: GntR family transcriptional regulator [Chloroflexota bacterium]